MKPEFVSVCGGDVSFRVGNNPGLFVLGCNIYLFNHFGPSH